MKTPKASTSTKVWRGALGTGYTGLVVYCHATFVTNPVLARVEAAHAAELAAVRDSAEATRAMLMMVKGGIPNKYE